MRIPDKPNLDIYVLKIYRLADKICSVDKDNKVNKKIFFTMLANWLPAIKNITISTCVIDPLKPGEEVRLEDPVRGHIIVIRHDLIKGPTLTHVLNKHGQDALEIRWYYESLISKILELKQKHTILYKGDYFSQIDLVYGWFCKLDKTLIKI